MSPIFETGHAKNVANFEIEISYCNGYGAAYNPTKPSITIASLNTLLTGAQGSLASLNSILPPWINAVNARQLAFDPLSKLVTRVIAALDASDVDELIVNDAKTIARKIQGRRAEPAQPDNPETPEDESLESISASQMSFDSRIENFDSLIQLLAAQANYIPNEIDLTVAALTALLADFRQKNTDVINAFTPVSNARIARDNILYAEDSGLFDIAAEVKNYVKSVYGATAAEFKQISSLKFTKPKKVFI